MAPYHRFVDEVCDAIDRAAGLATALAAAGGLLAMPGEDVDDDET